MFFGVGAIACIAGVVIAFFGVIVSESIKGERVKLIGEQWELEQERAAILAENTEAVRKYDSQYRVQLEDLYRETYKLPPKRDGYPALVYSFSVPDGIIAMGERLGMEYNPPKPELTPDEKLRLLNIERRLKHIDRATRPL